MTRPDDHERPALAAGQDAPGQRREQPRPHGRRLAAPRRPDDAHQACARQPGHHVRHEPLAPEEDRRVLDVERSETLERAPRKPPVAACGGRALAQALHLDNARCEVVLGQPPLDALGRGAGGRVAEPAHCLRARPLGRRLLYERGDTTGLLGDAVHGQVAAVARAGVEPSQGGGGIGREPTQREHLVRRDPVRLRRRCQHQERSSPRAPGQLAKRILDGPGTRDRGRP